MTANKTKWVRLGDYIEEVDERNTDLSVTLSQGIANTKVFQEPKQVSSNSRSDKIVRTGQFAYNRATTRNGEKISIAYRTGADCTVSSAYCVFNVTKTDLLNPHFLWIFFSRSEFDRYARYLSKGSAHEFFDWNELCRVQIPLPSMEVQQELVATYEGLKRLAEDNEALIAPLTEACQAFIVECKRQYPSVPLGDYIEEYNQLNWKNTINVVKSVSVTKEFKDTGAKVNKNELSRYKIVPPMYISYVQTTKNEKCFACALNRFKESIVVTSVNKVIRTKDSSKLNVEYLYLLLSNLEFDRYAIYHSWGSARETFSWDELCRVQIPLPPLEVQQSIVNLYHCMEEAKGIAREAREMLTTLCPALIRYAIDA